jgi:diacylglycerol kinase (ATP)
VRNQPKYNFFKNTSYAINGLIDIIKSENSFRIELAFGIILFPLILFLDVSITQKLLLFSSYMGILVAEAINSAIERIVDLVTLEYHEMAKRAKDTGSAIVFLSILIATVTWLAILYEKANFALFS